MAYKMMNKICDDIREKWEQVKHIAIYHRLGIVPIKESSVVIAISSPHRQDSLEAVQFAIDELKRTVPIWKKEVYGGSYEGTEMWKENKECGWANWNNFAKKFELPKWTKAQSKYNFIVENFPVFY